MVNQLLLIQQGWQRGSYRVLRGGYAINYAVFARCANRYPFSPYYVNYSYSGIRCVRGL